MPERTSDSLAPAGKGADAAAGLRSALSRQKKTELVCVLLELARENRGVLRQLTARFNVEATPNQLVTATLRAIDDATAFDKRDINSNFDYDYKAYEEVKRNLASLIASGQLRPAMKLSLELMKKGSYQVEMSDEGLMSDDIEECMNVVVKTVKGCDLPSDEIVAWCSAMLKNDRVGFIATESLKTLRKHFKSSAQ